MKFTASTRITIDAPAAEVFRYLADLKYHYLWNPQLYHLSSQDKLKLGSVYQTSSRVLGTTIKASNTVTKFVPLKELTIENKIGVLSYRANFKVIATGTKSAVKLTTTVTNRSNFWAFTEPVLKKLAMRELRTDLEALKIAVENSLV